MDEGALSFWFGRLGRVTKVGVAEGGVQVEGERVRRGDVEGHDEEEGE